jgi:hypothetical protein
MAEKQKSPLAWGRRALQNPGSGFVLFHSRQIRRHTHRVMMMVVTVLVANLHPAYDLTGRGRPLSTALRRRGRQQEKTICPSGFRWKGFASKPWERPANAGYASRRPVIQSKE